MEVSGQLHAPGAAGTHWTGAGLDAVPKRKLYSPCGESNPGRPARSLVTVLTEISRYILGTNDTFSYKYGFKLSSDILHEFHCIKTPTRVVMCYSSLND
jgi:hypothetical protein